MVHRWETKILRLTFTPKMQPGEEWVACEARTARLLRSGWKKLGLPSLAELCAEKVWKMMAWADNDGEVPVLKALRLVIGWRTTAWWRNRSSWGMKWDPLNITCWNHKLEFHTTLSLGIHSCPDAQDRVKIGYRSGECILPRRQKRFLHWYGQFFCHQYRSK